MAARRWRSGRAVKDVLAEEPWRFDPFQAVRIIERLRPPRSPVGEGIDPSAETVRFTGHVSHGFPTSAVVRAEGVDRTTGRPTELEVAFLRLAGQGGPLPDPYAELVRERMARRDRAQKSFLDMFTHRLVSLLVRAKRRHHPALTDKPPDAVAMASWLRAVVGLGTTGMAGRVGVPDRLVLRYAALFAARPRSMIGLTRMLADVIGGPVAGRNFVGDWKALPDGLTTALTDTRGAGGRNTGLGQGAVLGDRAWSQTAAIELTVGPLSDAQFQALLPGGPMHDDIAALCRLWLDDACGVWVRLVLAAGQGRGAVLGYPAPRLGQDAWLAPEGLPDEDSQTVFRLPDPLATGRAA